MTRTDGIGYDLSGLAGRRVLVIACGTLGAAFLHSWLGWLRHVSPSTELKVVVTRSALDFLGIGALRGFGHDPAIDTWDTASGRALHVEWAQWADGMLIHPASMHMVSRLCAGLCDTPAMLAMQSTTEPIVAAASAPPGFVDTPVWQGYLDALSHRPNVTLLAPAVGSSAADPSIDGSPPVMFPVAAQALSVALAARRTPVDGTGHDGKESA